MEFELVRVDSQGRINIPKEYMSRLGIKVGDLLAVTVRGNTLVIGKVRIELPWEEETTEKPKDEGKTEESKRVPESSTAGRFPKHFRPATDDQIHTILELCYKLDMNPPSDLDMLSYEAAEEMIRKLKARVERGEKPASTEQKRYIKLLSKKAGVSISDEELEKMTSREASMKIMELKKKLGME